MQFKNRPSGLDILISFIASISIDWLFFIILFQILNFMVVNFKLMYYYNIVIKNIGGQKQ